MNRTYKTCSICNKSISASNIIKHEKVCTNKKVLKLDPSWYSGNGKYKCPFCQKLYTKKGIMSHIWRTHSKLSDGHNPNAGYKEGRIIWNKGLTKADSKSIYQQGQTYKKKVRDGEYNYFRWLYGQDAVVIEKEKLKWNKRNIKIPFFDPYYNKEILLDSKYELTVARELNSNNVRWCRPTYLQYYDRFGDLRNYYADFYLLDYDVYLDPKNDFLIKKDEEKIKKVIDYNNVSVVILRTGELGWRKIKEKLNDGK